MTDTTTPMDPGSLFTAPTSAPATATTAPVPTMGLVSLPAVTLVATEPAQLMRRDHLPEAVVTQIDTLAKSIDFSQPAALLMFGAQVQGELSKLLDHLLADVKTEDAGVVGDLALEIKSGINELQIEKMREELEHYGLSEGGSVKSFLRSLPLIGKSFQHIEYFVERKSKVVGQLDAIQRRATDRMVKISDDQTKTAQLRSYLHQYLQQLAVLIMAGEDALMDHGKRYEEQRQSLPANADPDEVMKLRELHMRLTQLDARVSNMKVAYVEWSSVNQLQFLVIDEAGVIEISNLMNGVMFALPRLKTAILEVAELINIKKAQAEGKALSEGAEKAQAAATEMLHTVYTTAKSTQGDSLHQAEALQKVADSLIATLAEGEKIDAETAKQRKDAEVVLIGVRDKIMNAEKDFKFAVKN